jgi:hypothetical protein
MFDGKIGGSRKVDYGGKRVKTDARNVIDQTRKQREQRAIERQRNQAVVIIQTLYRRYITLKHSQTSLRTGFDKKINDIKVLKHMLASKGINFVVPADNLGVLISQLSYFFTEAVDTERLDALQGLVVDSLSTSDNNLNYLTSISTTAQVMRCHPRLIRLSKLLSLQLRAFHYLTTRGQSSAFMDIFQHIMQHLSYPLMVYVHLRVAPVIAEALYKLCVHVAMQGDSQGVEMLSAVLWYVLDALQPPQQPQQPQPQGDEVGLQARQTRLYTLPLSALTDRRLLLLPRLCRPVLCML